MKRIYKILETLLPDILILIGAHTLAFGMFSKTYDTLTVNLDFTNYHTDEKIIGVTLLALGILLIFRIKIYRQLFTTKQE